MKFRWQIAQSQPLLTAPLVKELAVSPLLAQCLVNRGLDSVEPARRFLEPRLRQLADPFLLPDMAAAVDRLLAARARGEPLVIFGDYDVDGVTSTTLLSEGLAALGIRAHHYLPHRMDEGYGLSRDAVENCMRQFPVPLLLAVDCGSTAVESIAWLRARGVDVIVLDHHQVSSPAPDALALVNPQRAAAGAPDFRELCSAGLAFKLIHALVKLARDTGVPGAAELDVRPWLELVALGTIADLVPLTGENRILVPAGLERLNATRRPGLLALMEVAGVTGPVGVYEVGFQLGPRLNAAGRLETAEESLRLLLAPTPEVALPIAHALDARNHERQQIERGISEEAVGAVKSRFDAEKDFVIVEGRLLWHIGVVGIVASRVLQQFYRPTLILGGDAHQWRGSGRSIEGFDLAAALRECDDLLVRHGGHAMAAGVTVAPENVDALRARLNDIARRTLRPEQLQPVLRLDGETALDDLTMERLAELARLQPSGMGNPRVQFCARRVTQARAGRRMGAKQQHVKLSIASASGPVDAVWWNAGDAAWPAGEFDLAFEPQVNEFNGRAAVQLKVLDWRPAA